MGGESLSAFPPVPIEVEPVAIALEQAPFRYTTQDGVVHEAKTQEEVFSDCPVFKDLSKEDAALLLGAYVEGCKEMAKERAEPPAVKPVQSRGQRKEPKKAKESHAASDNLLEVDNRVGPNEPVVPMAPKGEALEKDAAERIESVAEKNADEPAQLRIETMARSLVRAVTTPEVSEYHQYSLRKQMQSEPTDDRTVRLERPSTSELPIALQLPQIMAEHATQRVDQLVAESQEYAEQPAVPAADFVDEPEVVGLPELRAEIAELYITESTPEDIEASAADDYKQPDLGVTEFVPEESAEEIFTDTVVALQQELVALAEAATDVEAASGLALLQEAERLLELEETDTAPVGQSDPLELVSDSVILLRNATPEAQTEGAEATMPVAAFLETAGRMQDKPLEVAFAHVARFLKVEAAGDNMGTNLQEHPAAQELIEAVANLKNAYAEHADEPQLADRLSPRLVNELVKLMGLLGYEQPQEVLAAFAEQHGVQSLLEMIEYLCQLSHHENRKEFAPASTLGRFTDAGQTDNDDTHRLRVMAQGLFRLLSDLFALPAGFFDADLMPS